MDKLDKLVNEIKELVGKRNFKLFKLVVGDMDNKQSYTHHITWEQYVKNNRNPFSFTSRTTQTHLID